MDPTPDKERFTPQETNAGEQEEFEDISEGEEIRTPEEDRGKEFP
jgi:hypothetical protein